MSDLASWKPVISALMLPPGLLLVLLAGGLWLRRRHVVGALVVALCMLMLWLTSTVGMARWLQYRVLKPPAALTHETIAQLRTQAPPSRLPRATSKVAIVVLGAGRIAHASEYGGPNLTEQGMARLRYGAWLARQTGLPVAYSGGVGWAQDGTVSEAAAAQQILRDEYGIVPRWLESESRDTRENAKLMAPVLLSDGVRSIVLVTHAAHMPRAMRAFQQASGGELQIIPAPMGFVTRDQSTLMEWMPSSYGVRGVNDILHELLGLAAGA